LWPGRPNATTILVAPVEIGRASGDIAQCHVTYMRRHAVARAVAVGPAGWYDAPHAPTSSCEFVDSRRRSRRRSGVPRRLPQLRTYGVDTGHATPGEMVRRRGRNADPSERGP